MNGSVPNMPASLSIVIPVYNSEETLPLLLERLNKVFGGGRGDFEVVLVNDGSRGQSDSVIERACEQYPWVVGIELMRNYGQHNALLCGIRSAHYPVIVTMDDDLQNPPEEIPKLLEKLAEGYDIVYGYPKSETHNWLRNCASQMTKIVLRRAMGVDVARHVSSFRAFRTTLRDGFAAYNGQFVSIDVLLSWGTRRFAAVPVANPPRALGVSQYTAAKLIAHAMNMITGFSVLPLQLASVLGFTFAVFGVGVLGFVVGRFLLQGSAVPGFAFLASIISIFAGSQLFALGIIGEYLARMHFRLLDKPSYTVRSAIRGQHERSLSIS
jgi:glycosyltransferase involved in cell wall biosynthesis